MVTSTTLLIGRIPAARRLAFSQAGDGPIRTPSKARAMKRGQRSGHSTTTAAASSSPADPGSDAQGGGASGAPVEAWTSRAIPYTPRQSGRFGVISNSITSVPSGRTSSSRVPGRAGESSSRIPACSTPTASSTSERIIPSLTTPRSLAAFSLAPPGSTAPGRATATVWPAATFGAPQTIVAGPASPMSTAHTRRRSASGWGATSRTAPTT